MGMATNEGMERRTEWNLWVCGNASGRRRPRAREMYRDSRGEKGWSDRPNGIRGFVVTLPGGANQERGGGMGMARVEGKERRTQRIFGFMITLFGGNIV